MNTEIWKIVIWFFVTFGVVGLIALAVLFPAVMGTIGRGFMSLLGFVLNYRLGCALVAAVIAGFAVDYWRHSYDDTAFADRTAQFEQAQKDRDTKIAADTEVAVRKQIAEQAATEQDTHHEVDTFEKPLPTSDVFRVGTAAAELRGIAGLPVSKRTKGLPKATRLRSAAGNLRGFGLPKAVSGSPGGAQVGQPAQQRAP